MFKKIFCLMLVTLLMLACLVACQNDSEVPADSEPATDSGEPSDTTDPNNGDDDQPGNSSKTLELNSSTTAVRLLGGRMIATDTYITCDQAGSGIEFSLVNTGKTITFSVETSAPCKFVAYVNGAPAVSIEGNELFTVNGKGMITISNLDSGEITVRLIKLNGADTATAQLNSIVYVGEMSTTAPDGAQGYIEFVGGSLPSDNVMLSDAFAIAKAKNAEYSILSELSLLCGETDLSAAYLLQSSKRGTAAYDFAKKAKTVVVDLGAADYALSKTDNSVTSEVFAEKYEALLEAIISSNGTEDAPCRVICVYDMANGAFARAVNDVCANLGGQSAGIYTCQKISGDDGLMSSDEQEEYLTRLASVIELAEAGTITEERMSSAESGDGMKVSYKDFVKVSVDTQ